MIVSCIACNSEVEAHPFRSVIESCPACKGKLHFEYNKGNFVIVFIRYYTENFGLEGSDRSSLLFKRVADPHFRPFLRIEFSPWQMKDFPDEWLAKIYDAPKEERDHLAAKYIRLQIMR